MNLRLTLHDSARTEGEAGLDVEVDCPVGTLLADLRHQLSALGGPPATAELHCRGRTLGDDAVLGLPPLVHGAVLVAGRSTSEPDGAALLELHVVAGPDSGGVHRLGPGEHTVGRTAAASVRVRDRELSRVHAALRVTPGRTTMHDLGSTNGTTVDGRRVPPSGLPLRPGQLVGVGESRLRLAVPESTAVSCRPAGDGRLDFNRPPRLVRHRPPPTIDLPERPHAREPVRLPVLATLVPVLAGVLLVAVTGSRSFLLFVLVSPLLALGSYLSDRVAGRRSRRAAQRRYDEALADAQSALAAGLAAESTARHATYPDPATLLAAARAPTGRLWERRRVDPDHLVLRVGLGAVTSAIEVRDPSRRHQATRPTLEDVPVTVPLAEVGVIGVTGPRAAALGLARWLLAQLAGWHSPRDLTVRVLTDHRGRDPDWRWARWLPHLGEGPGVAGADGLLAIVGARRDATARGSPPGSHRPLVLVLDGTESLRRLPDVAAALGDGPAVGVLAICLADELAALPVECGAVVELSGAGATRATVTGRLADASSGVLVDGVGDDWARRFGRALAPLRDPAPGDDSDRLPASVRLPDLLPFDATDPRQVADHWVAHGRTTAVPLGVRPDGSPFVVDLAADGPHALVAGTTGSGKSELLQALVVGLAATNRPDELTFVLVDYKGAASFQGCASLPHTAGLVTDLDGHLTQRALQSLSAELRRRERLLRDAGCSDLAAYQRATDPVGGPASHPVLPRLVLVVDEFATLAEELPDFVSGLVGVAQRGRSMGVHLVLATQRPAGVVSADIRANTALRIALRVSDVTESVDVIDAGDAAAIGRETPGRAVARFGVGSVQPFQSAWVGGVRADGSADEPRVRRVPAAPDDVGTQPAGRGTGPTSDLAAMVAAIRAAGDLVRAPRAASPWLPPLPTRLTVRDVPEVDDRYVLPVGAVDRPERQAREALSLDLRSADHLLVAGGPRSGRTTLLRTIAGRLAARLGADEAHLFILDLGSALSGLDALPHCGAVVPATDPERAARLIARLADELDRRRDLLGRLGQGDLDDQRSAAAEGDAWPRLALLVDGWEAAVALLDQVDHGRPLEQLGRLVTEGSAAGVAVVLAGGRSLLTSRIAAAVTRRVLLGLPDPGDYALAGVRSRDVPTTTAPGRGVLLPGAPEVQVALLDADGSSAGQLAALQRTAEATGPGVTTRPLRVDPLPGRVTFEDRLQPAVGTRRQDRLWTVLGLGGDELETVGVDLAVEGPGLVIAGPPGSGRSTAVTTAARWLLARGVPVVLLAHQRSPLRRTAALPGVVACLTAQDAAKLARVLDRPDPPVVLADDAEQLHDSPVEPVLVDALRPDAPARSGVVLAGESAELAGFFRGVTVVARRGRCGLLLGPWTPSDGELFGVRLTRGGTDPRGRGLLVVRGRTTAVQVAVADGA